jgi:hypothetical protein
MSHLSVIIIIIMVILQIVIYSGGFMMISVYVNSGRLV